MMHCNSEQCTAVQLAWKADSMSFLYGNLALQHDAFMSFIDKLLFVFISLQLSYLMKEAAWI
jgi:hypothetical protein